MAGRTETPLDRSLFMSNEPLFFLNVRILQTEWMLLVVFFHIVVSRLRKKLLSVSLCICMHFQIVIVSEVKEDGVNCGGSRSD